jgi:hypothetical protein
MPTEEKLVCRTSRRDFLCLGAGLVKSMSKYSVLFLVVLLCASFFTAFGAQCKAATVWSDNFDSGNYNGWTVTNGTFSAADHTLRSVGGGGVIIHPSSVTTGTWSFDIMGVNDTGVGLMGSYPVPFDFARQPASYAWIGIAKEGQILGLDVAASGQGTRVGQYSYPWTKTSGWQHIDVTRSSEGRTCVYLNGTLVIDWAPLTNPVTTSEYFWVMFGEEAFPHIGTSEGAIDNIVVSSTVDIQPPPPYYMQTWFWAVVGTVIVAVAVVAVLFLRRKKS